MSKVSITIEVSGEDAEAEARRIAESLDVEDPEVRVEAKGKVPVRQIRLRAFQKDDSAGELLRTDPDSLRFGESGRSALTGTDKQKRILDYTRDHPSESINEVAEQTDSSITHVKNVLGSATPSDLDEPDESDDDDSESDPWGMVGSESILPGEPERQLDEPAEDSRTYEYLLDLMEYGPATVSEIARRSDFPQGKLESSIPELHKMKMAERTRWNTVKRRSYRYVLSQEGEALLEERGDLNDEAAKDHHVFRETHIN